MPNTSETPDVQQEKLREFLETFFARLNLVTSLRLNNLGNRSSQPNQVSQPNQASRLVDDKVPYADPAKLIWRTRDGREIPITKMSESHLLNTIAMLSRTLLSEPIDTLGTNHTALAQQWITVLCQEEERRRQEEADKIPDIFERLLADTEF